MKPKATLSLDLDNLWAYQRAHGIAGWDAYPSYLPRVVPSILAAMRELKLPLTVFIVGRDAEIPENFDVLDELARAGTELGNHSYLHEPGLARGEARRMGDDIDRSQDAIEKLTGARTEAFRSPSFGVSSTLLTVLSERLYRYDASTLPSLTGSLAQLAYRRSLSETTDPLEHHRTRFGTFRDGFAPLRPYCFIVGGRKLLELPVTTMPMLRVPIHFTYLHFLAGASSRLAGAYWRAALSLCRLRRIAPSVLIHPLDFLAADDVPELSGFPGLGDDGGRKRARTSRWLHQLSESFDVESLGTFASGLGSLDALSSRSVTDRGPVPPQNDRQSYRGQ